MGNQYTAVGTLIDAHATRKALASILIEQGATYREIREKTGLNPNSIARLKRGEMEYSKPLADMLRKREVDKLTLGIHSILDGTITPEKIEKASLQQGVTSAAILIEKRELLSGRATVRFGSELTDSELQDKIDAIEAEILEAEYKLLPEDMGDNPEN